MKKIIKTWEYKIFIPTASNQGQMPLTADLNEFGEKGWELVGILGGPEDICRFYFKRQKDEKN